MFRQNQPAQSLRKWPKYSEQQVAETFVLAWRSAFTAAIYALQSGTAYVGARVPARAAVNRLKVAAMESEAAEKLTIRIKVCLQEYRKLKIGSALAAEVIKANFFELSQTLVKKWKTNRFPKDERMVSSKPLGQHFCLLRGTDAAALIEFAVALPLLVVLIVGIFDFGGAFNLKQELNNAVREGARFGASQPTNDLALAKPPSVDAVRFLVDSYLQTAKINDCGLSTATWALGGPQLTWHFAATGNGCSMTLDVSRGVSVQETVGGATVYVLCTTVQIIYPYRWHFNSVIQLLVPGANYTLGNIQSDATAVNMN